MRDYAQLEELIKSGAAVKVEQAEKDAVYNMFVANFEAGDFVTALKIIEVLVLLEANNAVYLKSMASCYQQLKEYRQAFIFYNFAYILDRDNYCLYYMANCLVEVNELVQAKAQVDKLLAQKVQPQLLTKAKILAQYIEQQS